ncbi:hypothetical protein GCM10011506_27150 [Marivirga lumbricoides]|uniref:DUF4230 domain-containing protein n=3 Tax=Marivirga lumbricoides TaxID=1046115 RepID=A0ABQ1MGD0_9BACT|nr:hypothetical protein GCM10011506_27150 [Marivirga lumbricoides]
MSSFTTPAQLTVENTTILQEIEALGKLELVRYKFKEVIEAEEIAKRYFDLGYFYIPGGQDQKALLIAKGEAVACIDLMKIEKEDIIFSGDTIQINMPGPELCYYKVDLNKSSFYDLQTSKDKKKAAEFIDMIYAKAETQMKEAALESGILVDAEKMSGRVLTPFLSNLTDKTVILHFKTIPDKVILQKR